MILPYCSFECREQLKEAMYSQVMDHLDSYNLSPEWEEILKTENLKAFRIDIDPLDLAGDPAFFFKGFRDRGQDFPLSWMSNTIVDVLEIPHFIEGSIDYKKEVFQSALNRLGKISDSIVKNDLLNSPLKQLIDQYYNLILTDNFKVDKLDFKDVTGYCERISVEDYNDWIDVGEIGSGRKNPIKLSRLVFYLNIHKSNSTKELKTFDWQSSERNLWEMSEYWIHNDFIPPDNDFYNFQIAFHNEDLDVIISKIVWTDQGKNRDYSPGVLVEFIHILSLLGFISKDFQNPRFRNPVIQACFVLPDSSIPILANKRVNPFNPSKKVKNFQEFLTSLPSGLG